MSQASDPARSLVLEQMRPLAPLTTLQLGGPASYYVEADTRERLHEALALAQRRELPVGILGGGSNLIVADAGFSGLVVRIATRGIELQRGPERTSLTVQAGEWWDDVVELAVREGLAGIECLTGIPGSAGATPIQNVGAYGQEVSDVIEAVEVLERASGASYWLSAAECAFAYRDSRFKREPERFLVLAVRFVLTTNGAPCLRYGELSRALAAQYDAPSLRDVQAAVRALRASKGMLMDASYEPSAGSFFTNPLVEQVQADAVTLRALERGLIAAAQQLPRYPATDGRVKLAAGWLIERAGIVKGLRRAGVGVSSRHALALVNHGGTTKQLMELAALVQERVQDVFGLWLELEPVRWR